MSQDEMHLNTFLNSILQVGGADIPNDILPTATNPPPDSSLPPPTTIVPSSPPKKKTVKYSNLQEEIINKEQDAMNKFRNLHTSTTYAGSFVGGEENPKKRKETCSEKESTKKKNRNDTQNTGKQRSAL